jgi:hypothetical protein
MRFHGGGNGFHKLQLLHKDTNNSTNCYNYNILNKIKGLLYVRKAVIWWLPYNTNDIKTRFPLPIKLLHIKICGTSQKLAFFGVTNVSGEP